MRVSQINLSAPAICLGAPLRGASGQHFHDQVHDCPPRNPRWFPNPTTHRLARHRKHTWTHISWIGGRACFLEFWDHEGNPSCGRLIRTPTLRVLGSWPQLCTPSTPRYSGPLAGPALPSPPRLLPHVFRPTGEVPRRTNPSWKKRTSAMMLWVLAPGHKEPGFLSFKSKAQRGTCDRCDLLLETAP